MVKVTSFDTARHLDNPKVIKHYLAEAVQTGDESLIRRAKQNVRRAAARASKVGTEQIVHVHGLSLKSAASHSGQFMQRAKKATTAAKRAKTSATAANAKKR